MAMDRIEIKDLHLRCIIGTNDWERREKQDVLINVIICTDLLKTAGKYDDINLTIDYKKLKDEIVEMVENSSPYLLETLSIKIADLCIKKNGVKSVVVEAEKPGALRFARSVSVRVEREWKTAVLLLSLDAQSERKLMSLLKSIKEMDELRLKKVSGFYKCSPKNKTDEPIDTFMKSMFGAISVDTFLEGHELLERLKDIKTESENKKEPTVSPVRFTVDIMLVKNNEGEFKFLHENLIKSELVYFCCAEVERSVLLLRLHPMDVWRKMLQRGKIRRITIQQT